MADETGQTVFLIRTPSMASLCRMVLHLSDRNSFVLRAINDLGDLFLKSSDSIQMVERVEMTRRNVVVDGKVYSVKRESEPVFLLRLSDLSVRYLVVIADPIDFHGFQRLVWPINAEQISVFERLDDATAHFLKLTAPPAA